MEISRNQTLNKVLCLLLSFLLFNAKGSVAQQSPLRATEGFKPMLLKVEASTDQLEPGETLWLTCWWQNIGTTVSPEPLQGFLEMAIGHQRIAENTPRWHRLYWNPYPATSYWQPGAIWKTSIKCSPSLWGGTYYLTVGLCDNQHLPVTIIGENGKEVLQVRVGEMQMAWGWGQPTVERQRKVWSRQFNQPSLKNPSVSGYHQSGTIRLHSAVTVTLDKDLPAIIGIDKVANDASARKMLPLITVREYASDQLIYSSQPAVSVVYRGEVSDSDRCKYSGIISKDGHELARFSLHYHLVERQLQIVLDSVKERPGYELLEIKFPSLLGLGGKDVRMLDFFGGGRIIPLTETAPMGYEHPYDTRNAAALITKDRQVVLESTCLDDRLIQSVYEDDQEKTEHLGMVLVNRVRGRGAIKSIKVESDHKITIAVLSADWGKPSWQSVAKYLRRNLKGEHREIYRNALVYKILATEGPEPPAGSVKPNAPYGVKRLQTARKFSRIPGEVKKLYHLLDGMPQVLYIGGFQEGGFDNSYPYVYNTDPRVGSVAELRDCIASARKYNATIGLHDNYDDMALTKYYDPRIVSIDETGKPWKGWIWAGGLSHIISPYKYAKLGLMQKRVKKTVELYGLKTSEHLDVLSSEPLRYDFDSSCPASADRSMEGKIAIIDEYNKYGIDITSETLTQPFVGHIGFALWTRDNRAAQLFKAERYVPLIAMVYHGIIGYCGPSGADSLMLWNLATGSYYFPGEGFVREKDIGNIYLQQIPLGLFYDKKIDNFIQSADSIEVVYDKQNYIRVNFRDNSYQVVSNGEIVAKDWTTFAPGFKQDTYLAFSRAGGDFEYPLPRLFAQAGKLRAVTLTKDGVGTEIPCRIKNGNCVINMPAGTPVRVSIVK